MKFSKSSIALLLGSGFSSALVGCASGSSVDDSNDALGMPSASGSSTVGNDGAGSNTDTPTNAPPPVTTSAPPASSPSSVPMPVSSSPLPTMSPTLAPTMEPTASSSSGGADDGTGGTAGAGITAGAGAGGSNEAAGGSGGDDGSGDGPSESAGCGAETQQQAGAWVESMVDIGGSNRAYSTYLPDGYDPARAYPVILLLHGCGSGTNNLPMEREVGGDAIVIRGTGSRSDGCWLDTATGADMDYIDAMLDDVQSRFCTDISQFFAVGYSSGSWVVNQLACVRSDVFLGLASVTGGEPPLGDCGGPVARMFVHDRDDTNNLIAWSESARERMLEVNECSNETVPVDPSPCVSYQGCSEGHPVIWCETTGEGHNRQDNFAAPAFWDFFQELGAD